MSGFGTPAVVHLIYFVKLVLFVAGGSFVISLSTPEIGTLANIGDWWTKPILFQKFAA